jgi:hypothetical protein
MRENFLEFLSGGTNLTPPVEALPCIVMVHGFDSPADCGFNQATLHPADPIKCP